MQVQPKCFLVGLQPESNNFGDILGHSVPGEYVFNAFAGEIFGDLNADLVMGYTKAFGYSIG